MGRKKYLVYIRLNSGHKTGMGHLFRMVQLAKQFINNGFNIIFLIKENHKSEKILLDNGLKYISYSKEYNEKNIIFDSIAYTKPLAWVYDILNTKSAWINILKSKNIKVVCFDDLNGGITAPADLVINPIVGCWQDNINNINIPLYCGHDYSILSSEISNYRKKRDINNDNVKIGVTMGGSDTYGATVLVAKILENVSNNITANFFLGPSYKHINQLENRLKKKYKNLKKNIL